MALLPRHSIIGFIADEFGKCYTIDASNNVALTSSPVRQKNLPDGWTNFTEQWGRNSTYLGLDRAFSEEIKFVRDSARIARHLRYTGRGNQTKVFYLLFYLDLTTGVYENLDRLLIDLSQWNDDGYTVTTKLIQGGPGYYIKANADKVYTIPFGNEQVLMDGILLDDTFDYTFTPYQLFGAGDNQIGLSFLDNEGDNVGIQKAGQSPAQGAQIANSGNYCFSSLFGLYARIVGNITVAPSDSYQPVFRLYAATNLAATVGIGSTSHAVGLVGGTTTSAYGTTVWNPNNSVILTQQETFTFDETIYVDANANLFFLVFNNSDQHNVNIIGGTFQIIFESRNPPYVFPAMRPLDLFQKLMDNVSGNRYKVRSTLLTDNSDDYFTSGDAIRGIAGATIKISLTNFFQWWFSRGGALGIDETDPNNPIVWLEDQSYTFDNTIVLANLGEVSNFKIIDNTERLFSSIKVGSKDQTYDERAGKLEVNSENTFGTPVLTQQKELNLVTTVRTDAYGITFLGTDYFSKPTTDSSSDNDSFVVNVVDATDYEAAELVIGNDSTMTFISAIDPRLIKAAKFQLNNTVNNSNLFTVVSVSGNTITVDLPTTTEAVPNGMILYYAKILSRPAYNPLTVVPTCFNLKYTPARSLMLTQGYWGGGNSQLTNEYVTFLSGLKNTAVTAGMITENANIPISSIVSYWNSLDFSFDANTTAQIFSLLKGQRGVFAFLRNGFTLYGFADDVSIKPGFNDKSTWKLFCSSLVNVSLLETINNSQFYKVMGGQYSKRNPIQFVKQNPNFPAQYHFVNMDNDWYQNRISRYGEKRKYYQKWQINDTASVQVILDSASPTLEICDCFGNTVDTITPAVMSDSFINNPFILYQGNFDFSVCVPNRVYCNRMTIGAGTTAAVYLSEPFEVARDYPNTLLIEAWNSYNKPDMVFSTGFHIKIRVEGGIVEFDGRFKNTVYEDEPLDDITIEGISYGQYTLILGGDGYGLPDWMRRKLTAILSECDTVLIEGIQYTLSSDSFEMVNENPGSPLTSLKCTIRETNNYASMALEGSGLNNAGLLVTYGINTRAFTALDAPNADQTDNIVQITEVE